MPIQPTTRTLRWHSRRACVRFTALLSLGIAALAPLAGSGVVQYDVDIRWTSYGIPHIKADDYASAAYGYGYAFARDNICLMAEEFNKVNGERALHFGAGGSYNYRANGSGNVNNLSSDFFYELVMDESLPGELAGLVAAGDPAGHPGLRRRATTATCATRGWPTCPSRAATSPGCGRSPRST